MNPPDPRSAVHDRIRSICFTSRGRLVAALSARNGDIAGAEDLVSAAMVRALEVWPTRGLPNDPEAWLFTVARNLARDQSRVSRNRQRLLDANALLQEGVDAPDDDRGLTDRRLDLMLVCTHPAIDRSMHAPLILQTVIGLDGAQIARVWGVETAAMSQRLVRAKAKIRDARIRFEQVDPLVLPSRLGSLLDTVYAISSVCLSSGDWIDHARLDDLGTEALYLAAVIASSAPNSAEARGLHALLLFVEARRPARVDPSGRFVPLDLQDPGLWRSELIVRAERELRTAHGLGSLGRYQLEAAIQSAHSVRVRGAAVDLDAILLLYDALIRISPGLGSHVARAAIRGRVEGPHAGLQALTGLADVGAHYQPFWAVKAWLHGRQGDTANALAAYARAIALSEGSPSRDWLIAQAEAMIAGPAPSLPV